MEKTHMAGGLRCLIAGLLIVLMPSSSWGQEVANGDTGSLFEVPLEELINVEVISPSRVKQQMFDSPNAIWVVTREDIRRSGVRSLPEALRLAPGVFVAQISGNRWTVTIGGFSRGEFSNTLLVLVDGVSVYSTLYGYVDWDQVPVGLDEVERIEVIRGPGGVLYGANAVNGVISIITTRPGAGEAAYVRTELGTQGLLATSAGGAATSEDGKFQASYSAGYNEDNGLGIRQGEETYDYQRLHRLSLRTHSTLGEQTGLSLDGRYLSGEYANPAQGTGIPETTRRPESSIARARVDHYFEGGSQLYLQAFYRRNLILEWDGSDYSTRQDGRTQDLEFQHLIPFEALGPHQFIYGGGYRSVSMRHYIIDDNPHYYSVANGFVHDEWRFLPDWRLNLGVKYEQVSTIDPTWQWRAALLYYPAPEHLVRISAANAFRSPTSLENHQEIVVDLPAGMGFLLPFWPPGEAAEIVRLQGNEHLKPERMWSYEIEYRGLLADRVYLDLSYSYRQYEDLIAQYEPDPGFYIDLPPMMGPFGVVYDFTNEGSATSQAVEVGIDARITRRLQAKLVYGYVDIVMDSPHEDLEQMADVQPRHFGQAGLFYADRKGFQADFLAYYLGDVPEVEGIEGRDEYWRLDLRLAKTLPMRDGELEIGAVGQNLAQEWHRETGSNYYNDVRRGYYGYLEYRMR